MLAAIRSAAVLGIDAYDVTVEVDVALGLPQWTTVGLPASAVKESRERVGAALLNSGFTVPPRRITTNLAPADVRKEGTAFDLPIALGADRVDATFTPTGDRSFGVDRNQLSAKLALQLHRIPLGDTGFGSHDSINLTCPLNLTFVMT